MQRKVIAFLVCVCIAVLMLGLVIVDELFYTNPSDDLYPIGKMVQEIVLACSITPGNKEELSLEIADTDLAAMMGTSASVQKQAASDIINADTSAQEQVKALSGSMQSEQSYHQLSVSITYQRLILDDIHTALSLQTEVNVTNILGNTLEQSNTTANVAKTVVSGTAKAGMDVIPYLPLHFIPSDTTVSYNVITDAHGKYQISLAKGTYMIMSTSPAYPTSFTLHVTGKQQSYSIIYTK